MSISAVNYSSMATTGASARGGPPGMQAVEDLLGMSRTDIRSALDSGKSLADMAATKGVSKDDLVNAIATAIKSDRPGMTDDRAKAMATRIATQVPGTGGAGGTSAASGPAGVAGLPPPSPPDGTDAASDDSNSTSSSSTSSASATHRKHHHHHQSRTDNVLSAVSDTLGMQTSDLVSALKGGQNLGQLATSKGVSEDQLLSSIAQALQGGDAADSAYGSSGSSTTGTLVNAAA